MIHDPISALRSRTEMLQVAELLHRIGNDYTRAIAFASLRAANASSSEARSALNKVVNHLLAEVSCRLMDSATLSQLAEMGFVQSQATPETRLRLSHETRRTCAGTGRSGLGTAPDSHFETAHFSSARMGPSAVRGVPFGVRHGLGEGPKHSRAGYHAAWRSETRWNGVAILARWVPIVTRLELAGTRLSSP